MLPLFIYCAISDLEGRIRPQQHDLHSIAALRILLADLCFASSATARFAVLHAYNTVLLVRMPKPEIGK